MGQAWPMHNIDYRRLPNSLPVMGFPYKKSNCCQSKVYHLPTSLLHMNFLPLYRKFGLTIYRVFRLVVNPFLPPEMHDLCNINSNRKLEDFSLNRQRMDFKSLWAKLDQEVAKMHDQVKRTILRIKYISFRVLKHFATSWKKNCVMISGSYFISVHKKSKRPRGRNKKVLFF